MIGVPGCEVVKYFSRFFLIGVCFICRACSGVQCERIKNGGFAVVRIFGIYICHRVFIAFTSCFMINRLPVFIKRCHCIDIIRLALRFVVYFPRNFNRTCALYQLIFFRRLPQWMEVAHSNTPIGHRAWWILFDYAGKRFFSFVVLERMQNSHGLVKFLFYLRIGRNRKIHRPEISYLGTAPNKVALFKIDRLNCFSRWIFGRRIAGGHHNTSG